ncbi:GGDEF domain-containing protein [Rhizobium leguminosarum]|uniref:GGDEF domain-containing protein n=1 Tax=Rhizobium leguminosarum TaxID=384 RepID=UPI00143F7E0A|nr:GGDEF domain-containing protein [Rhizobium leguminosarum]
MLGKFPDGHIVEARTLLLADLDHFKGINETFGHSGGDAALKAFVIRVREFLKKNEFIARLGGEEFGIMLATADLQVAALRAEQIRERIASEPVLWNEQPMVVTTSIGIAVSNKPALMDAVLARADNALYQAKRSGCNRVTG